MPIPSRRPSRGRANLPSDARVSPAAPRGCGWESAAARLESSAMTLSAGEITRLLTEWSTGNPEAREQLMPLVFEDLRRMAERHFARENPGHTLQPTALVNEVYLKLIGRRTVQWQNRTQFFGFAAELMRHILVDHARARQTGKRGGDVVKIALADVDLPTEEDLDLIALDQALAHLATLAPRQARIVELKFFGGLTVEEIAELIEVSPRTVKRDWRLARIWLFQRLQEP